MGEVVEEALTNFLETAAQGHPIDLLSRVRALENRVIDGADAPDGRRQTLQAKVTRVEKRLTDIEERFIKRVRRRRRATVE
ncbi:MAG: hypothetical protein U1E42_08490 [Rhodospirillales bacterium]